MTIGGAFLGGGVELVPAGSCKLVMEIRTEDGKNLATTFSVVGGGQTYTATAGADGRAEITVPSGVTYTVTTSATGYDGLTAQTVIGDSATVQYVRFEAPLPRVKKSGDTMTGDLIRQSNSYTNNDFAQSRHVLGNYYFYDKDGVMSGYTRRLGNTLVQSSILGCVASINDSTVSSTIEANIDANGNAYGNAPSWGIKTVNGATVGTNDESDKIVTLKMLSLDPKVVHTVGNEAISGQKSFKDIMWRDISDNSAGFVMRHTKASGSTETYYNDIVWRDSSIYRAYIRCNLFPDGESVQIVPRNAEGGYGGEPLTVKWTSTNGMEVHVPSPPNNSNGVNAVNTAWANSNLVKKSGDTMTGGLSFRSPNQIAQYIDNQTLDKTVAPSSATTIWYVQTRDKNFQPFGNAIAHGMESDGRVWWTFGQNATTWSGLTVIKPLSDDPYANSISWKVGTNDNSDKILTIRMANSLPSLVHTIGAEEINGQKSFMTPIIDPQNQSGRVSAPNSNASAAPFYKIASISMDNINAWDEPTLTLDAEYGWSSTDHHAVTYRAFAKLGNNKAVEKVSLAKIWASGQAFATFLKEDHWFIAYNETQKVIEIWVKVEYDQANLNYRVRMSGRRQENFAKWNILTHNSTGGQTSLPSTDDGWILTQAIDTSNRMTYSTPSNATGQEIATADWVLGKLGSGVLKKIDLETTITDGNLYINNLQVGDIVVLNLKTGSNGSYSGAFTYTGTESQQMFGSKISFLRPSSGTPYIESSYIWISNNGGTSVRLSCFYDKYVLGGTTFTAGSGTIHTPSGFILRG